MKFVLLTMLLAMWVPCCGAQAEQQEVKHHGMMHAMDMQHSASKTARLWISNDAAAREMTIRVGPVSLPAHTGHRSVAQPRTFFLTIPFDGWLTAYHPRVTNARGQRLPNQLLHHAAFYNIARRDLLCANRQEHIFGAGGEMTDWPSVPGFGYHVKKGDRIRITTMFVNPTNKSYPKAFLEVRIDYRIAQSGSNGPKNVYPVWFDVAGCGNSSYNLPPGESTKTGKFKLRYSGRLLAVGGHLHDYGQWLVLKDATSNETIASLEANANASGHVLSMPIVSFANHGGYALHRGDVIKVTDAYNNSRGKSISDGAMGIAVGYFLPDHEAALRTLRRPSGR